MAGKRKSNSSGKSAKIRVPFLILLEWFLYNTVAPALPLVCAYAVKVFGCININLKIVFPDFLLYGLGLLLCVSVCIIESNLQAYVKRVAMFVPACSYIVTIFFYAALYGTISTTPIDELDDISFLRQFWIFFGVFLANICLALVIKIYDYVQEKKNFPNTPSASDISEASSDSGEASLEPSGSNSGNEG